MTRVKRMPLPTPGEHLAEFLDEMEITPYRLAKDIGVPATRIHAIIKAGRTISPDTGLRLSKYFGQSDLFWIMLQAKYDTEMAQRENAKVLEKITPYKDAHAA
ncbi:MAG: addiction module antidote protein, HigA family [Gammaproteobacteria bacterium]|nr:MAG: addiction module antidote protein, HigA family [Gammaproteobacteria bacterium]